jgi:hypothetical protein
MRGGLLDFNTILMRMTASTPLIIGLIVGLVICWQQRDRRPRVSLWLRWTLSAQLFWTLIGWNAYFAMVQFLSADWLSTVGGGSESSILIRTLTFSFLPATVSAVIWGCTFWAVLMIDDFRVPRTARD